MKLLLTQSQHRILSQGMPVTIQRPVSLPKTETARNTLLAKYPVKKLSQLNGVLEDGSELPLVVGSVQLNPGLNCIEFDVYDQHEVIL